MNEIAIMKMFKCIPFLKTMYEKSSNLHLEDPKRSIEEY
jgi:hypothetical protein